MSTRRYTEISCDVVECDRACIDVGTAVEVRECATGDGWGIFSSGDWCPDHKTEASRMRGCKSEYERAGGRQRGDRIASCHLTAGHPGKHEEADTKITWWGEHTPGKGLERIRTEMPGVMPDLTEADHAAAEAVIAAASKSRVRTGYQCAIGGEACPGHSSKWLMCDPATRTEGEVKIRPRMTDGCGPEHTYRGACVYAEQPEGSDRG